MNSDEFSKNEKPREYEVRFSVSGKIFVTIEADSLEDARAKAVAMDVGSDLDEVDDIDIDFVRKSPVMYRVIREGQPMQVSHLQPGDEPRKPGEYDF